MKKYRKVTTTKRDDGRTDITIEPIGAFKYHAGKFKQSILHSRLLIADYFTKRLLNGIKSVINK